MNINQMMRGLLGDAVSGETRTLDLKLGQIVRGIVLQALDNHEAIVHINGVQVRARLELPLAPGQSALLQVQPDSSGALVVLKAVALNEASLDDTFSKFVKLLALPNQQWALNIVRSLHRDGFPLNRTTVSAFHEATAVMPQGADVEQWMHAASATFKRGLPMTTITIASMRQAMFGRPTHELLDVLQRLLYDFASHHDDSNAFEHKPAQKAGARVLALLEQGFTLLRGGLATKAAVKLNSEAISHTGNKGLPPNFASMIGANWLADMLKWLGVDYERQLAKLTSEAIGGTFDTETIADPRPSWMNTGLLFPSDDAETEWDIWADEGNELFVRPRTSMQAIQTQTETLKSALLALADASDTPPAIKETAHQLVQQITGQQLLLTPERNNALFAHVMMFIPLWFANEGTTASIHIQTRRGKKGELDSHNCRLLFDMTMASLGATLVDVNIINKIVSLTIWNNHPAIQQLINGYESELGERLQGLGYQLLSLRATPLPEWEGKGTESTCAPKGNKQEPPDPAHFSSMRFKGVDLKI